MCISLKGDLKNYFFIYQQHGNLKNQASLNVGINGEFFVNMIEK